jgi:hypothetical protein
MPAMEPLEPRLGAPSPARVLRGSLRDHEFAAVVDNGRVGIEVERFAASIR